VSGNGLGSAGVAVVGLDTTVGGRPLIVEAAVYHLAGGQVAGGPFTYPAAVDAPLAQVPVRLWPRVRLAPPWVEVAGRLLGALEGRTVAVHDRAGWEVLCRHLPGWQPVEVLFTREVAQRWWPGLSSYELDPLLARSTRYRRSRVGPGAAAQAHAVAVLLATLLPALVGRPVPQPVISPVRTGVPDRPDHRHPTGAATPGQGELVQAAGGRWSPTPAGDTPEQPGTSPDNSTPCSTTDPGQLGGPAPVNSLVQPGMRDSPDKETWQHAEMRAAVQVRNFTAIYRLLQKQGYSQQRIAALTGQSQPEVSAIIHGRKVQAYDVMLRIVDGLGVPRGLAGFATCTCTDAEPDVSAPAP
jgi:predicted XRE-type DNA-binding protein